MSNAVRPVKPKKFSEMTHREKSATIVSKFRNEDNGKKGCLFLATDTQEQKELKAAVKIQQWIRKRNIRRDRIPDEEQLSTGRTLLTTPAKVKDY